MRKNMFPYVAGILAIIAGGALCVPGILNTVNNSQSTATPIDTSQPIETTIPTATPTTETYDPNKEYDTDDAVVTVQVDCGLIPMAELTKTWEWTDADYATYAVSNAVNNYFSTLGGTIDDILNEVEGAADINEVKAFLDKSIDYDVKELDWYKAKLKDFGGSDFIEQSRARFNNLSAMTDELLTSTTLESDIEILNKYVNKDNELRPTIKETLNSFYENNGQTLNDENGVLESYPEYIVVIDTE